MDYTNKAIYVFLGTVALVSIFSAIHLFSGELYSIHVAWGGVGWWISCILALVTISFYSSYYNCTVRNKQLEAGAKTFVTEWTQINFRLQLKVRELEEENALLKKIGEKYEDYD